MGSPNSRSGCEKDWALAYLRFSPSTVRSEIKIDSEGPPKPGSEYVPFQSYRAKAVVPTTRTNKVQPSGRDGFHRGTRLLVELARLGFSCYTFRKCVQHGGIFSNVFKRLERVLTHRQNGGLRFHNRCNARGLLNLLSPALVLSHSHPPSSTRK